ncbi:MAG: hypothetical protein ACK4YL_24920 [Microcystis sp.]|nr:MULTISPECIES: hypothetical protein [Microcystis]MCZ8054828.1 hypothetical protein [Microcystis sp. LE19-12.2C]MDJ0549819.1 hypothetical protein [Microcystis sp. M49637_WE12]MDJ0585753.1 hypothetical protein [Microcystis sp. M49636_WE2]
MGLFDRPPTPQSALKSAMPKIVKPHVESDLPDNLAAFLLNT